MRVLEISAEGVRRWAERWPAAGFPKPCDGYQVVFDETHRSSGAFLLGGQAVATDRLVALDGTALSAMETDAAEVAGLDVDWGGEPGDGVEVLEGHVKVRDASEPAGRARRRW